MGPSEYLEKWLRGKLAPPISQHMEYHAMLGEAWRCSFYDDDVAQPSGTVTMLVIPPVGMEANAHIHRTLAVHGDVLFRAYEDFGVSSSGTFCPPANYSRGSQGVNNPELLVYHSPTIAYLGAAYGPQFVPGGSTANAQGYIYRDPLPITMSAGIPALFQLQNIRIVGDIEMELAWWEDSFHDPNLAGNT